MHTIIQRWLAPTLLAGLIVAGASLAQRPAQKKGALKGTDPVIYVAAKEIVPAAPLGVEDIVERVIAFDRNKDGKVTKDELPERMQHLIQRGDTNKDGALDRDEIKKLAAAPEGHAGGQVRFPGPGAPGGFGVSNTIRLSPGVPGGIAGGSFVRLGPDVIEGVVDDLKLPARKREQAMAAVKAHQENVRKLMEKARAELLEKMKGILSEEELQDFRAALDRPRAETFITVGPRDTPRGGTQKKLDPPQK